MSDSGKDDKDGAKLFKSGPIFVNPKKKYGLITQNKVSAAASTTTATAAKTMTLVGTKAKAPLVRPCIFDEDDELDEPDDEDDANKKKGSGGSAVNNRVGLLNLNARANSIKKQTQIEIEKALKEDPTVFEYDAIHDKLEEAKEKLDPKQKARVESKEPKYIAGIMKAAAKRQMEFEKLKERKIQKERDLEGDLWSDKEVFVTSAYRERMEERERLENEERNQERVESLLDVRKQRDLSGFYSSMLKMRSGEMVVEEEAEKERRLAREANAKREAAKAEATAAASTTASLFNSSHKDKTKEKSYRVRHEQQQNAVVDNDDDDDDDDGKPLPSTSAAAAYSEERNKQTKPDDQHDAGDAEENKEETGKPDDDTHQPVSKKAKVETEATVKKEPTAEEAMAKLPKAEQQRIRLAQLFKKRTVGDKFELELMEFFQRKQRLDLKSYIERE